MTEDRGAATGVERVLPDAMVFGVAAFLLYRAQHFDFTSTVDQVGPDSWPKLILYMIMATSAFEGIRRLLSARSTRSGSAVVPSVESPFEREPGSQAPGQPPDPQARKLTIRSKHGKARHVLEEAGFRQHRRAAR